MLYILSINSMLCMLALSAYQYAKHIMSEKEMLALVRFFLIYLIAFKKGELWVFYFFG